MSEATILRKLETPAFAAPRVQHFPTKRIFDVAFSSAVLFLGAPVFACIGLAVRLCSAGSVIYGQERIGRGGVPFRCLKFRTMYPDADERLHEILKSNPAAAAEWKAYRKLKQDPRITPIGRFLRRSSLDELPQFWNVIRGDLSVVGPRAVVAEEIRLYFGHRAREILSIRPGITGLWQVSGRNHTSYAERVRLDESYVKTRSFWMDLTLIIRTIPAMLFPNGAY